MSSCNCPSFGVRFTYFICLVFTVSVAGSATRKRVDDRFDSLESRMNIAPVVTQVEKNK